MITKIWNIMQLMKILLVNLTKIMMQNTILSDIYHKINKHSTIFFVHLKKSSIFVLKTEKNDGTTTDFDLLA
jgi:hypothetical protein